LKRHISATNVWLSFLMSVFLMFSLWGTFDPRVLFVFVVALSVAEVFVQVRWRMGIRCQHCGFDPVVYMRDPKRAAAIVRKQFEERSQNLEFLFTDSPLLRKATVAHFKALRSSQGAGAAVAGSAPQEPAELVGEGAQPEAMDPLGSHFELTQADELVDRGLTRT
jgi:hypothetical protein